MHRWLPAVQASFTSGWLAAPQPGCPRVLKKCKTLFPWVKNNPLEIELELDYEPRDLETDTPNSTPKIREEKQYQKTTDQYH